MDSVKHVYFAVAQVNRPTQHELKELRACHHLRLTDFISDFWGANYAAIRIIRRKNHAYGTRQMLLQVVCHENGVGISWYHLIRKLPAQLGGHHRVLKEWVNVNCVRLTIFTKNSQTETHLTQPLQLVVK